ncbi:MAG: hypothetical protein PHW52_01830 [Candidatus Pacebacteria bacterium]|nr:hypothetical protein [Candidatus Paceibacterota bacterium]
MFFFGPVEEKEMRESLLMARSIPLRGGERSIRVAIFGMEGDGDLLDIFGQEESGAMVNGFYCKSSQVGCIYQLDEL